MRAHSAFQLCMGADACAVYRAQGNGVVYNVGIVRIDGIFVLANPQYPRERSMMLPSTALMTMTGKGSLGSELAVPFFML